MVYYSSVDAPSYSFVCLFRTYSLTRINKLNTMGNRTCLISMCLPCISQCTLHIWIDELCTADIINLAWSRDRKFEKVWIYYWAPLYDILQLFYMLFSFLVACWLPWGREKKIVSCVRLPLKRLVLLQYIIHIWIITLRSTADVVELTWSQDRASRNDWIYYWALL